MGGVHREGATLDGNAELRLKSCIVAGIGSHKVSELLLPRARWALEIFSKHLLRASGRWKKERGKTRWTALGTSRANSGDSHGVAGLGTKDSAESLESWGGGGS